MRKTRDKKTIIYATVFMLVALGNFYYFRKNFGIGDQTEAVSINLEREISHQYAVSSRSSVLETALFAELKKYGDWPVAIPDQVGRINPFVPFFEQTAQNQLNQEAGNEPSGHQEFWDEQPLNDENW